MGGINRDDLKKVLEALSKKNALHDGEIIEVIKEGEQEPTRVAISVIDDEAECTQCGPPTPRKKSSKAIKLLHSGHETAHFMVSFLSSSVIVPPLVNYELKRTGSISVVF
jgi:hypothetical protein